MIHLHNHTIYSALDGLSKIDDIIAMAKTLKAPAVAITDHASISALPEFYRKANEAGIKPIIGSEFYLTDNAEPNKKERRYHLTVLAKSWAGVQSIMAQLTLANNQFYNRPRLTFEQALGFEDCIIMSGCCIGILSHEGYVTLTKRFLKTYGKDFYLEIMPHKVIGDDGVNDIQEIVNKRAADLHKTYGVNLVATNDCHYVREKDQDTQRMLLAIQYHKKLSEVSDWGGKFHMKSIDEMVQSFRDNCPYLPTDIFGKAIVVTWEIMGKCNVTMPKFAPVLPSIYRNEFKKLEEILVAGFKEKVVSRKLNAVAYTERLRHEMGVINKLGFARYFLIVHDIINFANDRKIMVGAARGSAAGSLVCYLMGITKVDPIKHGLVFERFLNPERIDLPDIDMDFEDSRRHEVFDYITRKYGADKTARINTFSKLSCNSAFRDVCRVYGISPSQTNQLSTQIVDVESFDAVPDLIQFGKKNPQIIEMAKKLDGVIRQVGVHACGMVISQEPLVDVSAIESRAENKAGERLKVVCWDGPECEKFGLLKFDVLGLSTLSTLRRTIELIKEQHGTEIDLDAIPLDDRATLDAFDKGYGMGVFQFEGNGMQALLRSIPVDSFETVAATTALFRPGPLDSGQTSKYVKIKSGNEYETYDIPELEPILKETSGVIVYQEQIMRIFAEIGGFTWAHADQMRKIIGKKLGLDEFNKHKEEFAKGCMAKGVNAVVADDLFDHMASSASYSFNKSHAVAYSMISFWGMYLKVNYPAEFLAGYLTRATDDHTPEIVKEAARLQIKIQMPCINKSTSKYEVLSSDTILAPLNAIKGVGGKAVIEILKARASDPYLSIDDMKVRVYRRVVNVRVIGLLEKAGAFESLGIVCADEAQDSKNKAELLPVFSQLPSLDKSSGSHVSGTALAQLKREYRLCAKLTHKTTMEPVAGAAPSVMVINRPQKNEKRHLKADGTRYFMDVAQEMGFTEDDFYYTSLLKCQPDGGPAAKDCQIRCQDFLKKEIEAVRPKVIFCCDGELAQYFAGKKLPISKLAGSFIYNKMLDTYIVFSVSPQYAYYQPEKADAPFKAAMSLLQGMFK